MAQISQARRKWRKSHKLIAETTETLGERRWKVVKMMKVMDGLHPLCMMNCAPLGELHSIGHIYLNGSTKILVFDSFLEGWSNTGSRML
jgi:hypothetical protein